MSLGDIIQPITTATFNPRYVIKDEENYDGVSEMQEEMGGDKF